MGAVAGAGSTVWAERKVKQRLETLQPDHAVKVAADKARQTGRTMAEAVVEGRGAMREREQELKDRRDQRHKGQPDLRLVSEGDPSAEANSAPRATRR